MGCSFIRMTLTDVCPGSSLFPLTGPSSAVRTWVSVWVFSLRPQSVWGLYAKLPGEMGLELVKLS